MTAKTKRSDSIKKKLFVKYMFFFMITAVTFIVLLLRLREERLSEQLNAEKEMMSTAFSIIVSALKSQSDIVFYNRIQVPEIISLYRDAASASPQRQQEIREQLYNRLLPVYENIQLNHLKQLHFHLKNNDSFLRFHRPETFGDNLSDIRGTVAYVNRTHQPIEGFEEGRIFNGYRFVYPLFDGMQPIGSVELSVSIKTILEKFREATRADVDFIIRKDVVERKVFSNEQQNYMPCEVFDGFMNEREILSLRNPETNRLIGKYMESHGEAQQKLLGDEPYSFIEPGSKSFHILTFLPLVNAVTKETIGYIILNRKHKDIQYVASRPIFLIIGGTALLGLLFYLLCRFDDQKYKIESERQRLHNLLELQKNIVVLTDGQHIEYANKLFFDSFGYPSLSAFQEEHDSIRELFIEDERYFHLGKVPKGQSWIDALCALPATQRIVAMTNRKGSKHIFTVAINHVGEHNYIATFTDISLTISQQAKLEERASRDKLTDAYNREFLETNLNAIELAVKAKGKKLGVVMLDIDYFKRVNDTYGHASGDEVLKRFVEIIRETVRQEDYLIRWGGEEFLLLTMVDSIENVTQIAEKIRKHISVDSFPQVGHLTASIGGACHCEGEDFKETLKQADRALYEAKADGRNRVVVDKRCMA